MKIKKTLDKIILGALGVVIVWGGLVIGCRYQTFSCSSEAHKYITYYKQNVLNGDFSSAQKYLELSEDYKERAEKWRKTANILDPLK